MPLCKFFEWEINWVCREIIKMIKLCGRRIKIEDPNKDLGWRRQIVTW
jgi:hypothetical protein